MKQLRDRFGHIADRVENSMPYIEIDRDASDVEVLEAVAAAMRARERLAWEVRTKPVISVKPDGLPDSVADRLAALADHHPDASHDDDMRQLYAELDALERGDTDEYEQLIAFGSGNTARDLGIPEPEAVTFKWRLARTLAHTMQVRNLDASAVAELAGEIEPAQVERITQGHVRDVDSHEILRLLKALGYRILVELVAPAEGIAGDIWIQGPDDKL